MLLDIVGSRDLWGAHDELLRILRNADFSRLALLFDLVCDQHTFTEDVISDNPGANDATNYLPCMDSHPHI